MTDDEEQRMSLFLMMYTCISDEMKESHTEINRED